MRPHQRRWFQSRLSQKGIVCPCVGHIPAYSSQGPPHEQSVALGGGSCAASLKVGEEFEVESVVGTHGAYLVLKPYTASLIQRGSVANKLDSQLSEVMASWRVGGWAKDWNVDVTRIGKDSETLAALAKWELGRGD